MELSKKDEENLKAAIAQMSPEQYKEFSDFIHGADPKSLLWSDARKNTITELGILLDMPNDKVSEFIKREDKEKIKEFTNGIWLKKRMYFELCNAADKVDTVENGFTDIKELIRYIEPQIMSKKFYTFCESYNIEEKREKVKEILSIIVDADITKVDSRGKYINAHELKIIEKIMGWAFCGSEGKNPTAEEAVKLHEIYSNIEDYYYTVLNMYAGLGGLLTAEHEYEKNGKRALDLSYVYYALDQRIRVNSEVRDITECLVYDLGVYLRCYDTLHKTAYFNEYEKHYASLSDRYTDIVKKAGQGQSERKLPKDIKKRMMGLNTAFKKVYEEELALYGFKKGKGKYPYFFRVIGDEIIHVITCQQDPSYKFGRKEFSIYGGVFTVYHPQLTFDKSPFHIGTIQVSNFSIERELPEGSGKITSGSYGYNYRINNEEDMMDALKDSLEETKKYLIYEFDKVTNLKACIDFNHKYSSLALACYYHDNYGIGRYFDAEHSEWLLFFKLFNDEEYGKLKKSWMEEENKKIREDVKVGKLNFTDDELKRDELEYKERVQYDIDMFEKWSNDPVKFKQIMEELERRKPVNKEHMRKMGIEI